MKNEKSILVKESLDLIQDIQDSRWESGSIKSTKPIVNRAEYALNELFTLLVLRMEKAV